MGNKNAFLAEQERKQQWCLDTGIERGMQSVIDYMCIALNDPEVMGKNSLTEDCVKFSVMTSDPSTNDIRISKKSDTTKQKRIGDKRNEK